MSQIISGKIHVSANESISASGGIITRYDRPRMRARMESTRFGTSESQELVIRSFLYNLYLAHHKFIFQIKVFIHEGMARCLSFVLHRRTGKIVNFEISDQSVSRVTLNLSNEI